MPEPSTSPTELRRLTRKIGYRLSQADYTRLAHLAATANLSVNQLARFLALTRLESIVIEAEHTCNPALLKQLHHIGHNLNQLVKNAHIFGRISPQVEELCRRIDRIIDESVAELEQ